MNDQVKWAAEEQTMFLEVRDDDCIVFADHGNGDVTLKNDTPSIVKAVIALRNADKYLTGVLARKGVGVTDELEPEAITALETAAAANVLP